MIFGILLMCLPVVWALFPNGFYYSHDGAFHLIRLGHFFRELSLGQIPVRLGQEMLFGYGYPVFNFFYPLPYYLGSLLHFVGFDLGTSLKILIGASTIGSVFFMFLLLRKLHGSWPAFVGSVVWAYLPYRLLATYVNGALGIVIALFWVNFALFVAYRWLAERWNYGLAFFVIGIAGLITSHNVSAMMFVPLIVFLSLWWGKEIKGSFIKIIFATILGVGVSGSFLLPALMEKGMVKLDPPAVNYLDHFPTFKQLVYSPWGFWYSGVGENDGESFQVGMATWLAVALGCLTLLKQKSWKSRQFMFLLLVFFGLALLMMLETSIPIWKAVPLMKQIQFPWRILSVTGLIGSLLAAAVTKEWRWIGLVLVALAVFNSRNYLSPMETVRYTDDYYKSQPILWYGTTDIAAENTPRWVEKIPKYPAIDPALPVSGEIAVLEIKKIPLGWELETNGKQGVVGINQIYFPLWVSSPTEVEVGKNKKGLIELTVPEGITRFSLLLKQTKIERLGNTVSIISILITFGLFLFFKDKNKGQEK